MAGRSVTEATLFSVDNNVLFATSSSDGNHCLNRFLNSAAAEVNRLACAG